MKSKGNVLGGGKIPVIHEDADLFPNNNFASWSKRPKQNVSKDSLIKKWELATINGEASTFF